MNAFKFCALVLIATTLAGCASDQDLSGGQKDENRAVAGEATPAPEAPGGGRPGWAW